jgi:cobalt-zinc-cadmium efflux system protein
MSTDTRNRDHSGSRSHSHGGSADADSKRLTAALALIVGFMAVEVVAGIIVHSLALLSDAAHMLTDAGALAMSLVQRFGIDHTTLQVDHSHAMNS